MVKPDLFDDVEDNIPAKNDKVRKPKTVTKADRIKIQLEENDDIPPTGLFVGVNGDSFLIRPGSEVEVPPSVVEVLRNAVTSMPTVDPTSGQVVGTRDRMRYPFRVIS